MSKTKYAINDDEFVKVPHAEYNNLNIRADLGEMERLVSLIQECQSALGLETLIHQAPTHGGYMALQLAPHFKDIYLQDVSPRHLQNIQENTAQIKNIHIGAPGPGPALVISLGPHQQQPAAVLLTKGHSNPTFLLSDTDWQLVVSPTYETAFRTHFRYEIQNQNQLTYDNLLHLCIMVKNAGPQFESMLQDNKHLIDRWTILDTGSTDDTVAIARRVLQDKRGELYEEPFINFRDSRNRCLDLAGNHCKFAIMLDDTYVVEGKLREFLKEVRGDLLATSFSLLISSDDTKYSSNRIIKTATGLRYKYRIHEVIDDKNNINVIIPEHQCVVMDRRFDYMQERTMDRKALDLRLLSEEIEENPTDPRNYYYMAQTYNLLKNYEKAFEYFKKRAEFVNAGFIQERIDAVFESARLANFQLDRPWEECLALYEKAFRIDETRPETRYFIGIHHFLEGDMTRAHRYFKQAFEIGFPAHCQHSLKPTLSYHFLPIYLAKTAYENRDYVIGHQATELYFQHNAPDAASYQEMRNWNRIYAHCINFSNAPEAPEIQEHDDRPLFCFLVDGGFEPWTGRDIESKGVGGSETWAIEMARNIQAQGHFQVYVFCKCSRQETYEGVHYRAIEEYWTFSKSNFIHSTIVSRYTDYLPAVYLGNVENVFLIMHDVFAEGSVILRQHQLRQIFCLTDWHCELFRATYAQFSDLCTTLNYGIGQAVAPTAAPAEAEMPPPQKVPFKFIYSSFPDRGLLPLLQMWPRILQIQPQASLYIYSDVNGKWVNEVSGKQMKQVRQLLAELGPKANVYYNGWVNKRVLAEAWKSADIWFYPCIFVETFCMTALEAAKSRTLAVSNHTGALRDTIGKRGIIVDGNPMDPAWQEAALRALAPFLTHNPPPIKKELLLQNGAWADGLTWANQARILAGHARKHIYETRGMEGWINPIPTQGEKDAFVQVLQYFAQTRMQSGPINVLEVGSYSGMSLIHIMERLPATARGYAVDTWIDYTEGGSIVHAGRKNIRRVFDKNTTRAGMQDRITAIQGDSHKVLSEMVGRPTRFDFIYVDGSHRCLDCYGDILLAWTLLNAGGVLAIDDVSFDQKNEDRLAVPIDGVQLFCNRFFGQYTLLYNGYRLFLEKTPSTATVPRFGSPVPAPAPKRVAL